MNTQAPALVAEENTVTLIGRSEIEHQISTARRFPRSIRNFRNEALQMVTLSESVAEQCVYALPRDGKTIEGPSARFAEIIASAWGNNRAGARVIDDTGEFVTAQGVFHDLERNVAITYEVQRRITGRNGKRYSADMIGVTANAACSIALRNAILKGVPKAFWDDMYTEARKVIMGNVQTLANRRAQAIASFQRYGVDEAKLCTKLGVVGVEDIGLEHLVTLRGLLTAIREGDTTPEEAFEHRQPEQTSETKAAADDFQKRMAERAQQAAEKAAEAPAITEQAHAPEPSTVTSAGASPGEPSPVAAPAEVATPSKRARRVIE